MITRWTQIARVASSLEGKRQKSAFQRKKAVCTALPGEQCLKAAMGMQYSGITRAPFCFWVIYLTRTVSPRIDSEHGIASFSQHSVAVRQLCWWPFVVKFTIDEAPSVHISLYLLWGRSSTSHAILDWSLPHRTLCFIYFNLGSRRNNF